MARTVRNPSVEYRPLIRDLPTSERPRERLRERGAQSLSNAELLAILLRTGSSGESVLDMATKLLVQTGGLDGLSKASFNELANRPGLGAAKVAQIQAALEIGRRAASLRGVERPVIAVPKDVADLVSAEMNLFDQEHFRVLVLNTKNEVLASTDVFIGSVNRTVIRTAEVFREAVRLNAPAIILVHNHPSGHPGPSTEDAAVTREIVAAGAALDIDVLDHVIVGSKGFVSLREKGLGF